MKYLCLAVSLILVLLSYFLEKLGQRYIGDEGRTPKVRRLFISSRIFLIMAVLLAIYALILIFSSVV